MTRFNTQLVHGLPVGDNNTGAVNPPIYNSSTYAFESVGTLSLIHISEPTRHNY